MSLTNSAEQWDRRYSASAQVWSLGPNQFVEAELGNLTPGFAVDLAGGEGRNAIWLLKKGWKVENVDISKVAIERFLERASQEGLSESTIGTVGDATAVRFSQLADLVVVNYLQLENQQLSSALNNALGQLTPSGEIFGVWHSRRNVTEGFGGPPDPELNPSVEELQSWASATGKRFEVKELTREVQREGELHTAIDVQLWVRA